MRRPYTRRMLVGLLAVALTAGCGETAKLPPSTGMGPDPALPPPNEAVIPTLHIAPAKGWPEGGKPGPAPGTTVAAFATGLEQLLTGFVSPDGDAYGRSVGVALDKRGALLEADDVGNIIRRVTATPGAR